MSQKLTYTRIGDYYYPNLYLPTSDIDRPLGKYGMLRRTYLKQHCPVAYEIMLMGGTLEQHLYAINDYAAELVDQMIRQMAERDHVDEDLKASDPMAWVRYMNNYQAAAEEVVLREVVYETP